VFTHQQHAIVPFTFEENLMSPIGKTLLMLSLAGVASAAQAGPATDQARLHFQAIASGDVDQLLRGYDSNASLQWVGGPLDGVYAGGERLREVWSKFAKAQGKLDLAVNNVVEGANPKGATVTANVEFQGKSAIKVRYVLTYRDGKIVNEVWQIDPNLGASNVSSY
jgi:ketosteroid isomerase-like protein